MSELPKGWTEATLGEVGRYINGRGFKKSEWRDSGRPIIRIQNLTGTSDEFNYFDGEVDERHVVRKGDLLVSWAATLGVYKWTGEEAVLNQHIFKVESHIDPDFHRYLVQHALDDLYSQAHGSGMVHITKGKFDSTPVLLPPLAEQERIVAAIEEYSSHLDAAESSLCRARGRIARWWTASLHQLVSGPAVPLGDLIEDARYGTSTKCSYEASGPPVLRIPNVVAGEIDLSDLKYARSATDVTESAMVRPGDVLLVRTNGSRNLIGRTAVVREDHEGLAFASYLIGLRADRSQVDPAYLDVALRSPGCRRQLEQQAATTAGQYNLSVSKLAPVLVPVPSATEQRRVLGEIEERRTAAHRLQQTLERQEQRSERLRRSVLASAFAGDLAFHDPADEPAAALLQRIRDIAPHNRPKPRKASA